MNKVKNDFYKKINYIPKNESFFIIALTHSSYSNETGDNIENNEKYEFLGDSILGFITAEFVFDEFRDLSEGELTRLRATIICQENLAYAAVILCLGRYIFLGKGESFAKGREKPSILSDALEAIIAAIYLDGGLEASKKFVVENIIRPFLAKKDDKFEDDYKSLLQIKVQTQPGRRVEYALISQNGPPHDKTFEVRVEINGRSIASGIGKSKKEAEQMAAKKAINKGF